MAKKDNKTVCWSVSQKVLLLFEITKCFYTYLFLEQTINAVLGLAFNYGNSTRLSSALDGRKNNPYQC